ncbi:Mov34/MPN/PAD-1 family protein [Amycolatopsis thermoflava]|uniref:Mov34/MPN/PAD-1 family protein n=1 Tax=Amycolatopsis thermoflava TaxID=84480 RepID=UPI003EC07F98
MNDLDQVLRVAVEVASTIAAAAAAAHPRETGGILLGWWLEGRVIVHLAVEVPDPDATQASWVRDYDTAQVALRKILGDLGHPWLGYVRDWHSHPAAGGVSGQDLKSIQDAADQYDQPLALLVHRADCLIEAVVTESANRPLVRGLIPDSPGRGRDADRECRLGHQFSGSPSAASESNPALHRR